MKVYIENQVVETLWDFYLKSLAIHPALDYPTIINKIDRLENALLDFATYAEVLHHEPYILGWKDKGYLDFICEDFHFAYRIYHLPNGEKVLRFHDVVHSLLNHN